MSVEVLPGCEPFSHVAGANGVLVLHGFTGNPTSMRPLAERLADTGVSVELPRLPGHGTSLVDLMSTHFTDWRDEAEAAYERLAARGGAVAVVGLSMGGTLAAHLAETRPVAGVVLINPFVKADPETLEGVTQLLDAGLETVDAIGSDIKRAGVTELSYDALPLAATRELLEALGPIEDALAAISAPVLLFSSREDHTVPVANGDLVVERLSNLEARIWLEESFHVATLDNDRDLVERATVDFVTRILTK